jgi:hypothetical protein
VHLRGRRWWCAVSETSGLDNRRVKVNTRTIRKIRWLVEQASRGVHSNGVMHREDKKMILGKLAACKKELDTILQLEMFPQHQLE